MGNTQSQKDSRAPEGWLRRWMATYIPKFLIPQVMAESTTVFVTEQLNARTDETRN